MHLHLLCAAANERTFLSWVSTAVTLGGTSTLLASFGNDNSVGARKADLINLFFVPLAIGMILYALFTFYWRSQLMRKKQMGFFDDRVGPITLACVVLFTLLLMTYMALVDVFKTT